jgi:hypothetical protein
MQVFEHPDLAIVNSGLGADSFNIVCLARMMSGNAIRIIRNALACCEVVARLLARSLRSSLRTTQNTRKETGLFSVYSVF